MQNAIQLATMDIANLSNAQPKDPTTVPEPSAIMLFLIAGLALSFTNKKNTNAKF